MAITVTDLRTTYRSLLDETLEVLNTLKDNRTIGGDKYVDLLALAIQSGMASGTQFTLEASLQDKRAEQIDCEISKCTYEVQNILPKEVAKMTSEITLTDKQVDKLTADINHINKDIELLDSKIAVDNQQIVQMVCETARCTYEHTYLLPKEVEKITADILLLGKQSDKIDSEIIFTTKKSSKVDSEILVDTAQISRLTCETNKCTYELANKIPKEIEKLTAETNEIICKTSKCNYEVTTMLPQMLAKLISESGQAEAEKDKTRYEVDEMMPTERQKILMDISLSCSKKSEIDYTVAHVLPKQVEKMDADIAYLLAQESFMETKKIEMIADGLKDRESKSFLDLLHQAQTDLYGRQKNSFDDKKQTDIISKLLDVWTIEATNTIEANTGIGLVSKPQVEDNSSLEVILDKYIGTDSALATSTLSIPSPVITLVGDNPQNIALNDAYTELGATAVDGSGADITNDIVIDSSTVDTSVAATYHVTYTVTADSHTVVETRDVVVS